VRIALILNNH